MDKELFKNRCLEIESEIDKEYFDPSGNTSPIIDGIVDIEKYFQTAPKILWILKEPYDDQEDGMAIGGGWHLSKDFLAKKDFYDRMGRSRNTWHPIIYISYGIINDFMPWNGMYLIRNKPSMVDVVQQIAVINVKKMPGLTRTYNFTQIQKAYTEHKELLNRQIELYNPDIIIGGSTLHLFYDQIGIIQSELIEMNSVKYVIKKGKLYIAAYHPGQTQIKRDAYVDDIISTSKEFWQVK